MTARSTAQTTLIRTNPFEIIREDRLRALNGMCIFGALTLAVSGSSGSEYGDLQFYGVTDDLAIGSINLLLFNIAWFLQFFAIYDAITTLIICSQCYTCPNVIPPYATMICGLVFYILHIFLFDYAFWFNRFVTIEPFNLERDNVIYYVMDEIPTVLFLIGIIALVPIRYYQYSRPKMAFATIQTAEDIRKFSFS